MTGHLRRPANGWSVVGAALALSMIAAACAQSVDPRSLGSVAPVETTSPAPSATPTRTTFLASPSDAVASPPPPRPTGPPPPPPHFEAASVTFQTRATALKRIAKIKAHGFSGYTIERDKGRYEAEREFSTSKAAAADVRRLSRAGIRANVELSTETTPPPPLLPAGPPPAPPRFEAASTTFKTRAGALKRLAKLKAHGFFGYAIERDKGRYETEREFWTSQAAAADVRRLAQAGIRAKVELSTRPT